MNALKKMPVCFIGHGSPMNAIEENDYTKALRELSSKIPKPSAILVISAHWETEGTWITGMESPKTIHDFSGFPKELFEIQYPAKGSPDLAREIVAKISEFKVRIDNAQWGLDHGAWAVLRHIFPQADIPCLQLSMDDSLSLEEHFELGKKLSFLREKGVLILGSGNIVHNLRKIDWNLNANVFPWAKDYDQWVDSCLKKKDFDSLLIEPKSSLIGSMSVPSLEHYLPMLYVLGACSEQDNLEYIFEGFQNASISMRSFLFT